MRTSSHLDYPRSHKSLNFKGVRASLGFNTGCTDDSPSIKPIPAQEESSGKETSAWHHTEVTPGEIDAPRYVWQIMLGNVNRLAKHQEETKINTGLPGPLSSHDLKSHYSRTTR